jgi:AraC family transcriptional regulator
MEVYLRGPLEGLEPREWLTQVRVPVVSSVASLSESDKERLMNPEIKTLPAFTVIGQVYRGKNEHQEIPAMWDQLNAHWADFQALGQTGAAYGLCGHMEPDGVFEYLAGVQVTPSAVAPQGMTRWEVPAQIYAVFPCTLATIHQAYEQAYQVWLPGSGYEHSNGPAFELYPDTFEPDDPGSQAMFVYIPVTR